MSETSRHDPLPFDTTQMTSDKNYSSPKPGDPCHPLAAGAHPPAVAFEKRLARNGRGRPEEISQPLKAQSGQTGKGDSAPMVLTSSPEASPVRDFRWLDCGEVSLMSDPASSSNLAESLDFYSPPGSSSRMFQGFFPLLADAILESYSTPFPTSGMASRGEWSTVVSTESPNGAVECSLSDMLEEASDVPERYFLSPKAAAGILRRAEKRGKDLPAPLKQALTDLAGRAKTTRPTSQK